MRKIFLDNLKSTVTNIIENKSKLITKIILIGILCISIIPIVFLSIYSRPSVDDYTYAERTYRVVQENGVNPFKIVKEAIKVDFEFYNRWQGLYTSSFILALMPGILGERYYFIGAPILILLMFCCIYFSARILLKKVLKIKKSVEVISLIVLAFILAGLPNITEGLYWFNGAWNYIPFVFLTFLNISLLIENYNTNNKKSVFFSVIISFVISGGNHVTAFLNIMILFLYSVVTLKKNKNGIYSLIAAIVGFIIMYKAPGTQIRQDKLESQGFIDTIIMSAKECWAFLCNKINIQYILGMVALIPIGVSIRKENTFKKSDMKFNPVLLLLVEVALLCGMLCVPYKAMGNFGAGRVTDVIWIAFIILSGVWWLYSIVWLSFDFEFGKQEKKSYGLVLILIVSVMLFYKGSNSNKAINSLTCGSAKNYAECCDKRYKMMRETSEEVIYVEPLPDEELLKFDDITSDTEDWRNRAWKRYYNKDIVLVK